MKTHTFSGHRYRISTTKYIGGIVDESARTIDLVAGNRFDHLDNAVHEALHAMGVPDRFVHKRNGQCKTTDLARFLWRLGYRRVEEK